MKTRKITTREYADKRKISLQAVVQAIQNNRALPHVTKHEKFGRFYLLTVEENFLKEN